VKSLTLSIPLMVAAVVLSPIAHAGMVPGNYELRTPRDPGHFWIWAIRSCVAGQPAGCVAVQAVPTPNGQAAPYRGNALLENGRYTMVIDVPDGVRCTVYFLPSHDVYSWDAVTLIGSVQSTFDAGCGGAPGGADNYPFTLVHY
jgi:hypothetical protein